MSVDTNTNADTTTNSKSGLIDTIRVIVHALLLALIFRVFFYQSFQIPSGSMKPTLLIGDHLFVSKLSYGYSKYSFPRSPDIFSGRILSAAPKRGDVVVFRPPQNNTEDYIKRLIGLPGDRIQVTAGVLHINGEPVKRTRVEDFVEKDTKGRERHIERFEETLPNGVIYQTLNLSEKSPGDYTPVFVVPEGHYFMMGDNRDDSKDSRFQGHNGVGYVPYENLVGRADVIYYSVEEGANWKEPWRWALDSRWSRVLNIIR
jgi:signal peptidase I